jgi:hypothetical protein
MRIWGSQTSERASAPQARAAAEAAPNRTVVVIPCSSAQATAGAPSYAESTCTGHPMSNSRCTSHIFSGASIRCSQGDPHKRGARSGGSAAGTVISASMCAAAAAHISCLGITCSVLYNAGVAIMLPSLFFCSSSPRLPSRAIVCARISTRRRRPGRGPVLSPARISARHIKAKAREPPSRRSVLLSRLCRYRCCAPRRAPSLLLVPVGGRDCTSAHDLCRGRGGGCSSTRADGGARICSPSRTTSARSPTLKGATGERSCKTTARSDGNDLAAIQLFLSGSRAVHRCRRCRPARPRIFELPVSGSQRRLALDQLLYSFLASLPPSWPISLAGRHVGAHADSIPRCQLRNLPEVVGERSSRLHCPLPASITPGCNSAVSSSPVRGRTTPLPSSCRMVCQAFISHSQFTLSSHLGTCSAGAAT